MTSELAEFKGRILTGRHEGWNRAVNILRLGITEKMGLTVREAFLVVAFRHVQGNWGLMGAPTVTKDDALEQIAKSYQEARSSTFRARTFTENGTVEYLQIEQDEKSTEEPHLVSMPVGLAFVGKRGDRWADEASLVGVDVLADILGRSEEREAELIADFVYEAARHRIDKLTGC